MPQYPSYPNVNAAGAMAPGFVDAQKAQYVGQRHGKYSAASLAGSVAIAANAAATALTVALATTYTGLALTNPAGSGKLLIPQRVGIALPVAAAAGQSLGIIGSAPIVVHTTPATVRNARVGESAAGFVGLADVAATLVTPFWLKWLGSAPAVAGTNVAYYDLDGEIILPPGSSIAIGGLIASGAAGFLGSISWEEINVPS